MRHLLDVQLLDAEGARITKIAGIEVEMRDGSRPLVKCLLNGPEPLARRIGPRVGRAVEWLTGGRRETRIPWEDVLEVGMDVSLRNTREHYRVAAAKGGRLKKIVRKIPGSE